MTEIATAKPRAAVNYLFERPENGRPVEIFPGIFWLRVALPFALDHVNLWLLRGDDGWTIIDAGYADDGTRAVWETVLGGLMAGHPVRRVIATHFHPDHVGLAGWLCEKTGAELVMTRTEWLWARMLKLDDSPDFAEAGARNDRRAGVEPELIEKRRQRGNRYRFGVSLAPASFSAVRAGEDIDVAGESWRVMIGEGHAPEMITLFNAKRNLLIAADQVLPRISPVVAVWATMPEADPLSEFLRSLDTYRVLPEDCSVLPSHDGPFEGLHRRIDALIAHHDERLEKTLDACRAPASVSDILPKLFRRKMDLHNIGFALGESLAHVNHLWHKGALEREADKDCIWRYRRV